MMELRQRAQASQEVFEKHSRKGERELFMDRMEQVAPWPELPALAEPHNPMAGNGRNRQACRSCFEATSCSSCPVFPARYARSV